MNIFRLLGYVPPTNPPFLQSPICLTISLLLFLFLTYFIWWLNRHRRVMDVDSLDSPTFLGFLGRGCLKNAIFLFMCLVGIIAVILFIASFNLF